MLSGTLFEKIIKNDSEDFAKYGNYDIISNRYYFYLDKGDSMETGITNRRGLSGSVLKLIAIFSMAIDHLGAVVVEPGILHGGDLVRLQEILSTDYGQTWLFIDRILRTAGRVAFPIFCFLLVEGFLHTRDVKRYLINLSVFALISEVFFDLAIFDVYMEFGYQNVFFTLAIGLLTLIGLKRYEGAGKMQTLVIIGGCILAILMRTDYSIIGILIIVCFYMLRNNRKSQFIAVGAIAFFESFFYFGAAALALIPIYFYNGERGRVSFKYAFYIFYPAHLLLLFLIRYAINT